MAFRVFLLLGVFYLSQAFYLPGLAPTTYCAEKEDTAPGSCKSVIPIYVNRLNSIETIVPYEYHSFDFCTTDESHSPVENLGQVVFGERIRPSPYKVTFKKPEVCKSVCQKTYKIGDQKSIDALNFLKKGISLNYQQHWILDNLPITWCYEVEGGQKYCSRGFPIGCYVTKEMKRKDACVMSSTFNQKDTYYVFNHVDIAIQYHSSIGEDWGESITGEGGRIISARLSPRSIKHRAGKSGVDACDVTLEPLGLPSSIKDSITFNYTYSYGLIMNSLVIVLFLSGMVAMIMLRTLHKDIARYNQMDNSEDAQEEFGWKLVHGDVFRPPRKGMLLAILNGCGVQMFFMTFITLVFACLGFLSPANRGALMTCALCLEVKNGNLTYYVLHFFVQVVFGIFFLMNLVLWIKGSSAAIPFSTLIALLALWFGISVPLTFVGAYFGFKRRGRSRNCYGRSSTLWMYLYSVILYIKQSQQTYYMFGFLMLVFAILIITCAEATILLCYFHLCAEDYHWWWRSFLTSGFTAVYLFIYSIHYFVSKLEIHGSASTFLYFGYTLIMVCLFFVLTGTIGFFSCFWFVTKIYSVVKVD
ncbi:LOW QUALITY PROTEIN: hypothetical protein KUTeg_012736 [Tegillarca granosa]|uniref:Transmembrane 9 superfamily member n=1 Tax=Tegillarca granosa TaxID=220873 RepID=A0ABQ9F3V0_TEGGR|nr:LOW QUALITY PROTEIN: hypothetical protein KUTeg_012736 [Tegillarca granosa]